MKKFFAATLALLAIAAGCQKEIEETAVPVQRVPISISPVLDEQETKASSLYALSDFRANGEASVRKTSDYMKNYFISRYGAIEDIDFTDIIADVLKGAESDG